MSELKPYDTRVCPHGRFDVQCDDCTINYLRAEVARLREALERYGRHYPNCSLYYRRPDGSNVCCTCGLDAAKDGTMSHTPGLWEYDKQDKSIKTKDGIFVAQRVFPENAPLLLSATDLLALVEEMAEYEDPLDPVREDWWDRARAVLARVRGEGA